MAAPGLSTVDIGRLVAALLWRLKHGAAYGMLEGRAVLDRRDRNALTGAEFLMPALANPRADLRHVIRKPIMALVLSGSGAAVGSSSRNTSG